MEKTLEERIGYLEEKVAELEGRAPAQPKEYNLGPISIEKQLLTEKNINAFFETLKKSINEQRRSCSL